MALVPPAAAASPPDQGAFGSASVIPLDASVVVRVRGGAALRAGSPIIPAQDALLRLADQRVVGRSWEAFAAELGLAPGDLANRLLGDDATYAERQRDGRAEWVVVTRTDQAMQDLMVARLAPTPSVGGRSSYPRLGIATAWRPPYLVLGPSDRAGLLDACVGLFDGPAAGGLAALPELAPARAWEPARIEVLWRHGPPVGGWSAFALVPEAGALRVRHRSVFLRSPLHVAPGAPADTALLDALGGSAIAVLSMNPWLGEPDAGEPLDAVLLEGQVDGSMRANLGARQAVVLAESALDGSRIRVPAVAVAFEVRDPVLAARQWDGWGARLAESLCRRAGVAPSPRPAASDGQPRAAGAGAAIRAVFADHPFSRQADLCWVTVAGPDGAWQVIASEPSLLREVARALPAVRRAPDPEGAHEVGRIRGRVLASHLRSWLTDPAPFASSDPAAFSEAVRLLADLAEGMPSVEWRARAHPGGVVESDWKFTLGSGGAMPAGNR